MVVSTSSVSRFPTGNTEEIQKPFAWRFLDSLLLGSETTWGGADNSGGMPIL
jgi:hypothetical protein